MDRNKLIQRIRKLLAHCKGDSPEARSAAAMALKLRAQYRVTDEELDDSENEHTTATLVDRKFLEHWRIMLLKFLTEPIGVKLIRLTSPDTLYVRVTLIGTKGQCLDVIHAYEHFERVIQERMTTWDVERERKDYARGLVMTIRQRWKNREAETAALAKSAESGFKLTWTPAEEMANEPIRIPAFEYKTAYRCGLQDGAQLPFPPARKRPPTPPASLGLDSLTRK